MGSKTSPRHLKTAERRALVLSLRHSGSSYIEIAVAVLEQFGADNLPAGWDELYAYKDVRRELDKVHASTLETAENILQIELQRLDKLTQLLWGQIFGEGRIPQQHRAIDRLLRVMERRGKLLGLEGPSTFVQVGVVIGPNIVEGGPVNLPAIEAQLVELPTLEEGAKDD